MITRQRTNHFVLLGLAALVVVVFGLAASVASNHHASPQSRAEAWKSFQSYTASLRLPGETPISSESASMGCFASEPVHNTSLRDCTFSSGYTYIPKAGYREFGNYAYDFLKQRGYYFDSKDSQQKFERTLSDTKIANNLSNAEPIIVDLKHKNGAWVRFTLGDKGRLMGPGFNGNSSEITNLKNDQLISSVVFYKTL